MDLPMTFDFGKRQVVTLLRWRVVELYYREVDELLYELSDLVDTGMFLKDVIMDGLDVNFLVTSKFSFQEVSFPEERLHF